MKLGEIQRGERESAAIDLAPLIDMIFILLIFFMVSARFTEELAVPIDRPGAASGEAVDARPLRVLVDARGGLYVDDQPVTLWMIRARIADALARAPERPVLVVADRQTDTGTLVQIIDACRRGGALDVGLDVERR